MVVVREIDPPEEFEPVDWILYTSLPVDSAEQIEAIVDHYRGRWLIEEFNKALKTGCSLESRQLESLDSLLTLTAILIPIACQSLALRAADRVQPEAPASTVITDRQVIILRSLVHLKVPEAPTVHDALLAVARLGGHLRHNGPPGWLVLARGLRKLLLLEQGWLAREGCDQS